MSSEMLLGETNYLNYVHAWIRNMTFPYGTGIAFEITDAQVTASYVYDEDAGEYVSTEDDVITLSGSADEGWYVETCQAGYAEITAYFNDSDGETQSITRKVHVIGTRYWIASGDLGNNNLLVGESRTVQLYLAEESMVQDDEGNYTEDVTYHSISEYNSVLGEGYSLNLYYDDTLISAEVADDGICITGLAVGETGFDVEISDEDGNSQGWGYSFNVTEEYYTLTVDFDSEIVLGGTLNLSSLSYTLTRYYAENDETCTEEIDWQNNDSYTIAVEWFSEDVFEYANDFSEEDALPTLVRVSNSSGHIEIVACYTDEDGTSTTIDGCYLDVDYIDFDTTMTASYSYYNEEDDYTYYYVFDTEDLILTVDQSGLPEGCTVEFYLGGEEDSYYVTLTDNKDGTATLSVNDDLGDYTSGYGFGVYARVYYNGNQITGCGLDLEVLVAYENYDSFGDYTLVLGEGSWFDNLGYHVRDLDHIWGEDGEVNITAVKVTDSNPDDGESDVISLDGNSDEGWNINTISTGSAGVTAEYTDLDGEEQTFNFTVNVTSERYWVDVWYTEDLNTDQLLVGASREVSMDFVVRAACWDDDGNYWTEDYYYSLSELEDLGYSLTWGYDGDGQISVKQDGDSLIVTGDGAGYVTLYLYVQDGDGNTVASGEIGCNVTTDSYYIITGDLGIVPLGDTLDLSAVDFTLTYYYIDEDGNACTEEVELDGENYYAWLCTDNVDWNAWVYADGSSDEDALPALVRTGNWWTNVQIVVYNSNGDWLCDFWPYVDGYDYGCYIENTYNEENYIFELVEWEGNTYDFPEGYEVSWNVYVDTEDGWTDASEYGVTWNAEGSVLTITGWENHTDVILEANVSYQNIEFTYNTWYNYTLHKYELSKTVNATCTEDGYYYYICTDYDADRVETISATGHSLAAAVTENEVAATCTTAGSYDTVIYCAYCGEELARATTTVPATGHTWDEGEVTTAATCTTNGVMTYTCTVCDATYTEAISATGHTAGTAAKENVVAATCTTDGSYNVVTRCEDCNAILSSYTIAIAATGHTYESVIVAPTRVTQGYTTYTCT
ncbi:MAG: hypothetical protein LUD69_05385, partial [Oscillospiraceae bacterium]|nr:hypothetical protein [Oscillospiraceae bacterium]